MSFTIQARAPSLATPSAKVYERLDIAATGQIIDRLPPETTSFVVSRPWRRTSCRSDYVPNRYLARTRPACTTKRKRPPAFAS